MSILDAFSQATDHPLSFLFCTILALVPSLMWIRIFYAKHKEKKSVILFNFLMGMVSAVIVLGYQYYWGEEFNLGFFSVKALDFRESIRSVASHPILISVLVFLSVGFLEEYSKHWVVKKTDQRFFRSIDDVIELSIVVALGFAFLENVGYFFMNSLRNGGDGITGLFIVRSVLVTFIHVLCSGIYGYFYGLGYFAKPFLKDEKEMGKHFIIPDFLHRIFHWKRERVFADEMMSLGLIISVLLHAIYDFILDIDPALLGFRIAPLVAAMFLSFGFFFLNMLINDKEDKKIFGRKVISENFG